MYIDAGTGSMILQAAAAIFFTGAVFFRQIAGWCREQMRHPAVGESHE